MFNPTEYVIDAFVKRVYDGYKAVYGAMEPDFPEIMEWAGRMALERLSNTDCLYHDVEHTILVTLVGQEILRGKQLRERSVEPRDWLHAMIALLCHDLGYVRGICQEDRPGEYVIDASGRTNTVPRGASDAYLAPFHIDRTKLFVRERFNDHPVLDVDVICACVERTRFPIPEDASYQRDDDLPALIRAADLIGQLADPMYLCKVGRLFQEFEETGANAALGYKTPADVSEAYPKFYWDLVSNYIQPALGYLRLTHEGKQWVANLYAHVFAAEHGEPVLGPELKGCS